MLVELVDVGEIGIVEELVERNESISGGVGDGGQKEEKRMYGCEQSQGPVRDDLVAHECGSDPIPSLRLRELRQLQRRGGLTVADS